MIFAKIVIIYLIFIDIVRYIINGVKIKCLLILNYLEKYINFISYLPPIMLVVYKATISFYCAFLFVLLLIIMK